jgi:hypothetical protein
MQKKESDATGGRMGLIFNAEIAEIRRGTQRKTTVFRRVLAKRSWQKMEAKR